MRGIRSDAGGLFVTGAFQFIPVLQPHQTWMPHSRMKQATETLQRRLLNERAACWMKTCAGLRQDVNTLGNLRWCLVKACRKIC